jgi:hypothetical protein
MQPCETPADKVPAMRAWFRVQTACFAASMVALVLWLLSTIVGPRGVAPAVDEPLPPPLQQQQQRPPRHEAIREIAVR